MLVSAALLIRELGARATSIDDVLQHSRAPRGSVYYHFPGGRGEMLRETTALAGKFVTTRLRAKVAEDPVAALDAVLRRYRDELVASDFRAGCPVLAVAIEARDEEDGVQAEAGAVFREWTDVLADSLAQAGISPARAGQLATLTLAAAEGAIAMSRAQRDIGPLDDVRAEIGALLTREASAPPPHRETTT
jgi:AcrR family transcriptional regulator